MALDSHRTNPSDHHWVDIWTCMPQLTEPENLPPPPFTCRGHAFVDTTIRQTVHLSLGANRIRLRFSNAFGEDDVTISSATVSSPDGQCAGTGRLQPGMMKRFLTFGGESGTAIPAGGLAVSDILVFTVKAQSNLSISIYISKGLPANAVTSHPGSRTTTWMTTGNQVASERLSAVSMCHVDHWYFVSAVEAILPRSAKAFAILGDSITDGRESDHNQNNRWPDLLLAKMQRDPRTSSISIMNQAAGGNRILHHGLGPNLISRIDRDVLAHSGVGYVMVFEGVNDIGVAPPDPESQTIIGDRLKSAYRQIVLRIHAFGIPVFGATITPFGCQSETTLVQGYAHPERERTRQRVNDWIRTSEVFDAVLDFDRVLCDPASPSRLAPEYDSGDHLHLNVKAFQKLADYFPLEIFQRFAGGVDVLGVAYDGFGASS